MSKIITKMVKTPAWRNADYKYQSWVPQKNTRILLNCRHHPAFISTLTLSDFPNAVAGERRTRRRRHVLHRRWLPPPPVTYMALAVATGAVDSPRHRCCYSCPLLPPLVRGVPVSYSVHRFYALHACLSPLWSSFCSLRHRCPWPRLAPVSTVLSLLFLNFLFLVVDLFC